MNKAFKFHHVHANVGIWAVRPMASLSEALSTVVDAVWDREQQRLGGCLFNGRVFSADVITHGLICGHWTEFRRAVAQMRHPELYPSLGVRPLAVGGIICGPDGVVFGRRPQHAIYQAGEWQLPPAGSVDPSAAREEGMIDLRAMLLTELREEIGLTEQHVRNITPIGIVEHAGSHVLDFGIALRTDLDAAGLQAIHASHGNQEYGGLVVVPEAEVATFLGQPNVNLQAPIFLAALGDIEL